MEEREIERVIRITEIAIAVGRSVVPAVLIFVGINIALAVHNFTLNVGWVVVHSLLALVGLIFLGQIRQTRRRHRVKHARDWQLLEKYRKAASAE